ncbi:MAG: ATP-binding cassette domain-containing protein [Clostridia bacterium]|nr:ATP-binding cassette domain-containing protein [Clostridia bacterium]
MAFLELEKVSFTYPGAAAPAIRELSFSVEEGELIVLTGATGSGKSTLLRLLKRELAPRGERRGVIRLGGADMESLPPREAAFSVGYVLQRPEEQIVTDKVWHELCFGLENMGLPREEIARRVAETASYFGIESWYELPVCQLSGGQKQLLNLAAVMAMQPRLLLLDEPTAQLDPIAAADLIATIHRLNRDMGLTVLVIEHRLEELLPLCHRALVLREGQLLGCDSPARAAALMASDPRLAESLPSAARMHHLLGLTGECPLSVSQGRQLVQRWMETVPLHAAGAETGAAVSPTGGKGALPPALELKQVYFRYERTAQDVLRGVSLRAAQGEILCLLGGNGSGKSTLLGAAAGLRRVQHGQVRIFGQKLSQYKGQSLYRECVALLPQDVETLFLCDTVREELARTGADLSCLPFDLTLLPDRHPYDLSGGEKQLLALAMVLAQKPRLLLMDEPTKGLDACAKKQYAQALKALRVQGTAIVIVTHDAVFAADCADRCLLLFRGQVAAEDAPGVFFGTNLFYTTPISRMTRGLLPGCVTVEEAAARLGKASSAARKEGGV